MLSTTVWGLLSALRLLFDVKIPDIMRAHLRLFALSDVVSVLRSGVSVPQAVYLLWLWLLIFINLLSFSLPLWFQCISSPFLFWWQAITIFRIFCLLLCTVLPKLRFCAIQIQAVSTVKHLNAEFTMLQLLMEELLGWKSFSSFTIQI